MSSLGRCYVLVLMGCLSFYVVSANLACEQFGSQSRMSISKMLQSLRLSWGLRGGSSAGVAVSAPASPKSSRHGFDAIELRAPAPYNASVLRTKPIERETGTRFPQKVGGQAARPLRPILNEGTRMPLRQGDGTGKRRTAEQIDISTSGKSSNLQKKVRKIDNFSDSHFYGSEAKEFLLPMFTTKGADSLREIEDLKHADFLFEVFPTQADAFSFADCRPSLGLQVFAADKECTGAKKYLVATYKGFWRRYTRMPPAERHLAEMIRKGATCRLYFDLEFRIPAGADTDAQINLGNDRVDCMLRALDPALRERFGSKYAEEVQVLELDSSTDVKFSRHLIVPNVAFLDNQHAGAFVRHLSGLLPADVSACIDQGVYTKNRCFRMMHSSKLGKNATFEVSGRAHPFRWRPERHTNGLMHIMYNSRVPGQGGRQDDAELVFMHSLICFTHHQHVLLEDPDTHAKLRRPNASAHAANATSAEESGTYKPSPLPELDRFVVTKARPGAQVKRWSLYRGACTISYALLRNRYCERIGRPHRSNHVSVVVDLARGCWRQHCLDPDCASFRGVDHPLPPALFERRMARALRWEEARATAGNKIRASLGALLELKARQVNGTLTPEHARHLLGTGLHVTFNATHVTLYRCKELWRELRSLGFSYDMGIRGWVQALPAVVLRAGLTNSNELTRERMVRMLERAFLEEESQRETESTASSDDSADAWEQALRVHLDGDAACGVVVVDSTRELSAEEQSRLINAGFTFEEDRAAWVQGEGALLERAAAMRVQATEESECSSGGGAMHSSDDGVGGARVEAATAAALEVIRGARACRVEVEAEAVTVWDAPFGRERMEEAGFREVAGGAGVQCWWRRREEVAGMLGLVSAIDITAEGLLAAIQNRQWERAPAPSSEGSELDALTITVTHGKVDSGAGGGWEGWPGKVHVEAPAGMQRHLQGLGFRHRRGGGCGPERVCMTLTEAEARHLLRTEFAGGEAGGRTEVTAEAVRGLIERSTEIAGAGVPHSTVQAAAKVNGDEVAVEGGYEIRGLLAKAGLSWDRDRKAWVGAVRDIWGETRPEGAVGPDGVLTVCDEELMKGLKRPRALVVGDVVAVEHAFELRNELRLRGFKWDARRRAWVRPLREVLRALNASSPDDVTVAKILETSPVAERRHPHSSQSEEVDARAPQPQQKVPSGAENTRCSHKQEGLK